MTIIQEQKLVNLTDSLVPENIKNSSPQFYGLVKSFLRNIEDVQSSINNNMLDVIDISKIKNSEIIDIYIDTYSAQFEFDDDIDSTTLTSLIRVSKDLSTRKGTSLIYTILTKLLVYLIPQISTTYSDKLAQYNTITDDVAKAELEAELELLRINNWDFGILEYYNYNKTSGEPQLFDSSDSENENIIPFRYRIESDYEESIFNKYFKPFCHPLGWELEFISVIYRFIVDTANLSCTFNLYDCFVLPELDVGSEVYVSEDGIENLVEYPHTVYNEAILGVYNQTLYNTIIDKVFNVGSVKIINDNIVYKFDNFGLEEPYEDSSTAILREKIGSYSNSSDLNYTLKSPGTGGLVLVGQKYYFNNLISNWNGGVITNNGSNTVVYQQFISNRKK